MKRQPPQPSPGRTPLQNLRRNNGKVNSPISDAKNSQTSPSTWGFLESLSKMMDPWAPGGFYFYLFVTTVLLLFFTMSFGSSNVIELVFIFSDVAIVVACLVACYMVYKS